MKKFANQKYSRTFVSGMRKQGSLRGIILLVISFSVINYVVSKSVRLRQADTLFLCVIRDTVPHKKALADCSVRAFEEVRSGIEPL